MTTYWPEIKQMEDRLENGNVFELITFILRLQEKGLLNRHIFHGICELGDRDDVSRSRWDTLHELAGEHKP
jgi:hypothetical protein